MQQIKSNSQPPFILQNNLDSEKLVFTNLNQNTFSQHLPLGYTPAPFHTTQIVPQVCMPQSNFSSQPIQWQNPEGELQLSSQRTLDMLEQENTQSQYGYEQENCEEDEFDEEDEYDEEDQENDSEYGNELMRVVYSTQAFGDMDPDAMMYKSKAQFH